MSTEQKPETRGRWDVDLRDIMAVAGVALAVAGAWMIHPGLAVAAAGLGLAAGAWYLAKRG